MGEVCIDSFHPPISSEMLKPQEPLLTSRRPVPRINRRCPMGRQARLPHLHLAIRPKVRQLILPTPMECDPNNFTGTRFSQTSTAGPSRPRPGCTFLHAP